jgi:hypothetical protein
LIPLVQGVKVLQFLAVMALGVGLASVAAAITYVGTAWLWHKPCSDAQGYAAVAAVSIFVLVELMVLISGS